MYRTKTILRPQKRAALFCCLRFLHLLRPFSPLLIDIWNVKRTAPWLLSHSCYWHWYDILCTSFIDTFLYQTLVVYTKKNYMYLLFYFDFLFIPLLVNEFFLEEGVSQRGISRNSQSVLSARCRRREKPVWWSTLRFFFWLVDLLVDSSLNKHSKLKIASEGHRFATRLTWSILVTHHYQHLKDHHNH